jgi:biotin carboxyl carrier protein
MYTITVSENRTLTLVPGNEKNTGTIDGAAFQVDILDLGHGHLHVLKDNKSWNVEVVSVDRESKMVGVKVNGTIYNVSLRDRFDQLLKELGMESSGGKTHSDVKAPMPGLVLEVLVSPGQEVEKDTPLLILEAMKMENVIKSPASGTIKSIGVKKGQAVEKNELLVSFS